MENGARLNSRDSMTCLCDSERAIKSMFLSVIFFKDMLKLKALRTERISKLNNPIGKCSLTLCMK